MTEEEKQKAIPVEKITAKQSKVFYSNPRRQKIDHAVEEFKEFYSNPEKVRPLLKDEQS
jgi:hypothetical protein